MRAWQVVGAGEPRAALALGEVALGPPPPGMLRVRVEACGLGLPDVFMCRGSYALTPKTPFTPGQELAGVVLEAGQGARARVGARVMAVSAFFLGHGGFAEEAWALDDFCFPVPGDMPVDEAAAFLIPYHTAWVGLVRRGALRAGETLLVIGGAGGTGSAAIQLGRAIGARVIATARGARAPGVLPRARRGDRVRSRRRRSRRGGARGHGGEGRRRRLRHGRRRRVRGGDALRRARGSPAR